MPTTAEWKVVRVPADHPAWNAIDDDDWNGHTFANWLSRLLGSTVVIWPPPGYDNERLGRFLTALMNAGADRIVRGATYPPDAGNFCHECLPLAQDIDSSLKDVRDTLKRLADAAEAAMAVDGEHSDNERLMDEFENMINEARQLLRVELDEPKRPKPTCGNRFMAHVCIKHEEHHGLHGDLDGGEWS